jgi:hypothetical protein
MSMPMSMSISMSMPMPMPMPPMLLHAVHPALGEASTTNLTLALTLTLSLTLTLYYSRLTWVGARPRERSSSFARDSAARRAVSSPSA